MVIAPIIYFKFMGISSKRKILVLNDGQLTNKKKCHAGNVAKDLTTS